MRPRFQQHKQTKAQNNLAFKMWLSGCSDEALDKAEPSSLARSYGLDVLDVQCAIKGQRVARRFAR